MSRYRLLPTPAQQAVLREHCGHARYVWNLAVEQHSHWHPGRKGALGYLEQCRQLTQARAAHPWLREGSQTVQQQALRDSITPMQPSQTGIPRARTRDAWQGHNRDCGVIRCTPKVCPADLSRSASAGPIAVAGVRTPARSGR